MSTPKAQGFFMPGEHARHEAIWMVFPDNVDTWRANGKPAQLAFYDVAKAISQTTPVYMAVNPASLSQAESLFDGLDQVNCLSMASNDSWMRDIGPSFLVKGGQRAAVDWPFNAWGGVFGGLYLDWSKDDAVASKVATFYDAKVFRAPLILEGGSIHVDGEGTIYTTKECLLNPNRNPDLSETEIEGYLLDYLGAEKVIWLEDGLFADEDTNGHIDNLLHVVEPGKVLLTVPEDKSDPQFKRSQKALEQLAQAVDAKGRHIEVIQLPMPGPLFMTAEEAKSFPETAHETRKAGVRLAASYANFLITNGQVVFPLLDPKTDAAASSILQRVFPEYQITGVPGREILLGGGNIHCITQQVPKV